MLPFTRIRLSHFHVEVCLIHACLKVSKQMSKDNGASGNKKDDREQSEWERESRPKIKVGGEMV